MLKIPPVKRRQGQDSASENGQTQLCIRIRSHTLKEKKSLNVELKIL
jgi:hypothetical protein